MSISEHIEAYLIKHLDIDLEEKPIIEKMSQEIYKFVRKSVIKDCVGEVYKKADELIEFEHKQGFTSLTATFGLHYWQCEKIADHLIEKGNFTDQEKQHYVETRLDRGLEIYKQRRKNIVDNINKKD